MQVVTLTLRYLIKQHHDDQPDYRYSQPGGEGPQVTLAQVSCYGCDPCTPCRAHLDGAVGSRTRNEQDRAYVYHRAPSQAHTHTHAHTHVHIHTHTCTHTRADTHTHAHTHTHAQHPKTPSLQHVFSFDEAHPGIAGQHCMRTVEQEAQLQDERRRLELKRRKWVVASGRRLRALCC